MTRGLEWTRVNHRMEEMDRHSNCEIEKGKGNRLCATVFDIVQWRYDRLDWMQIDSQNG